MTLTPSQAAALKKITEGGWSEVSDLMKVILMKDGKAAIGLTITPTGLAALREWEEQSK